MMFFSNVHLQDKKHCFYGCLFKMFITRSGLLVHIEVQCIIYERQYTLSAVK